mmetsp:Transcript_20604/g.57465  ORF Transcript_20604/g.57465 Transcript_20604/m.57465 type:complete len:113 (+) Transcript_20604:30-368(+)
MSGLSVRGRALSLYRNCLRSARTWQALEPQNTEQEREYILTESKAAFRAHQSLPSHLALEELDAGEKRYEYAWHYRIPYPRIPVHPRFQKKFRAAPLPPPVTSRPKPGATNP